VVHLNKEINKERNEPFYVMLRTTRRNIFLSSVHLSACVLGMIQQVLSYGVLMGTHIN